MIVSVENLTFSYTSGVDVLHNINAVFPENKICAVLGENGSGKSTLLSIILGWLYSETAKISIGEKLLSEYSRQELSRKMAIVSQSEYIPFHFSVLDFLLLGRTPYLPPLGLPTKADTDLAYFLLEQVKMLHFQSRAINELSGGEKQMLCVLRALMQEPKVLLLDEPSSHLDPSNTERLADIFQSLKQKGLTLILATHDYMLAQHLADTAVLLRDGCLIASGQVNEVLTSNNLEMVYERPFVLAENLPKNFFVPQWLTKPSKLSEKS